MPWLRVLISAAALAALLGLLIAWLLVTMALKRGAERQRVFKAPHNAVGYEGQMRQDYEDAKAWWEDVPNQDVFIESHDGLRLHALEAKQPGHRYAVCVHGYTGQGTNMRYAGRQFYQRGYSLLLPDCRAHGESQGRYITMGWLDRLDLLRWIERIVLSDLDARIVLYGISMGAGAVMMTAGESLPKAVTAVVADCGFTSAYEEFRYQLKAIFGLPAFPIMPIAMALCRLRAGFDLREASAVNQLQKAKAPVLFIHGETDTFVPAWMLDKNYAACGSYKERLLVPGAGHAQAPHADSQKYWETVFGFIERAEQLKPAG
ncbi:MAG: alpha/beta fold hydrolase [Clostridiales bacterium]|nr:alpha/beta fold hydrolase [Clostridiales bacterium]